MKFKKACKIFVYTILLISILGVLIGWSVGTIDKVINFLIPVGISFILSAFTGELIENYTDDTLKKIFWVIKIKKIKISISLFAISIIVIKKLLFG